MFQKLNQSVSRTKYNPYMKIKRQEKSKKLPWKPEEKITAMKWKLYIFAITAPIHVYIWIRRCVRKYQKLKSKTVIKDKYLNR